MSLNLARIVHVRINTANDPARWADSGLGCLVSGELGVTACHVIREAERQEGTTLHVKRFDVDMDYVLDPLPAAVVFADEIQDVALLRLGPTPRDFRSTLLGLPGPTLRPMNILVPNQDVTCYFARPFGGESEDFDPEPSRLAAQRLRLLERRLGDGRWLLTQSIRFSNGNSGGPITDDASGDIIGVCTQGRWIGAMHAHPVMGGFSAEFMQALERERPTPR